jgi:hypothetical protein
VVRNNSSGLTTYRGKAMKKSVAATAVFALLLSGSAIAADLQVVK